jgi:DNA-binding SARP family transcriptional activator
LLSLADAFGQQAERHDAATGTALPVGDPGRPTLEIDCLGAFAVRLDGDRLDLRSSGKSVGVLKFVATRPGQAAPREQLIEALWPDSDADAASNRLRVAVHSLRRMVRPDLTPDLVLYQDGMYRIDPTFEVVVDANRFSELLERAERLEQSGDSDRAITLYREAELLYRGDYLEEDLYEDWAQVRRENLRDVYLTLEYRLAVHARERGNHAECVDRASKIVERDSCNEEAYALLIRSHAERGHPTRALKWFDVCERALKTELGMRPSVELIRLRDSILERSSERG